MSTVNRFQQQPNQVTMPTQTTGPNNNTGTEAAAPTGTPTNMNGNTGVNDETTPDAVNNVANGADDIEDATAEAEEMNGAGNGANAADDAQPANGAGNGERPTFNGTNGPEGAQDWTGEEFNADNIEEAGQAANDRGIGVQGDVQAQVAAAEKFCQEAIAHNQRLLQQLGGGGGEGGGEAAGGVGPSGSAGGGQGTDGGGGLGGSAGQQPVDIPSQVWSKTADGQDNQEGIQALQQVVQRYKPQNDPLVAQIRERQGGGEGANGANGGEGANGANGAPANGAPANGANGANGANPAGGEGNNQDMPLNQMTPDQIRQLSPEDLQNKLDEMDALGGTLNEEQQAAVQEVQSQQQQPTEEAANGDNVVQGNFDQQQPRRAVNA